MIYKNFQLNCLVRIGLITLNLYIFFYLLFNTQHLATTLIIGLLPLFQVAYLFRYVNTTNRLLADAFEAVKYENFSEKLNTQLSDLSFQPLCAELNRIVEKFQKNRLEKAQQFQYLTAIIHQTGMGLISIRKSGRINLINKAARRMLNLPNVNHIRQIEAENRSFTDLVNRMQINEKASIDVANAGGSTQLAVYASEVRSKGEHYRLITIQNIQKELEEKEMEAWKKLIRVLSHEIMNSITPISSLAATANLLVKEGAAKSPAGSHDLEQALSTIEKRSQGLMQFVKNYRRFAQIPAPHFQILPVANLFRRIDNLIRHKLEHSSIAFEFGATPENLQIRADANLIEQVLLNLMSNAIEAVKDTAFPSIRLSAVADESSHVILQVEDNGCGIEKETLSKVFIPFFTTRSKGSGIGLSLSRQIMRMHGGRISIDSDPGSKTVLSLVF
jgi:two-component system nitrogen regulation sensor histidine kinase NtrY